MVGEGSAEVHALHVAAPAQRSVAREATYVTMDCSKDNAAADLVISLLLRIHALENRKQEATSHLICSQGRESFDNKCAVLWTTMCSSRLQISQQQDTLNVLGFHVCKSTH